MVRFCGASDAGWGGGGRRREKRRQENRVATPVTTCSTSPCLKAYVSRMMESSQEIKAALQSMTFSLISIIETAKSTRSRVKITHPSVMDVKWPASLIWRPQCMPPSSMARTSSTSVIGWGRPRDLASNSPWISPFTVQWTKEILSFWYYFDFI